jgi:alpha-amylase
MATVVLYCQVHQPVLLRRYTVFDESGTYFDDRANRINTQHLAERCYRPATRVLLDSVRRHEGNVRVALSITGTALEQLQQWAPDVLELFQELIATGCCELLGETSHHSLSFLSSPEEFEAQVKLHRTLMQRAFNETPRVFRNTELMYSNDLACLVSGMRDESGEPMFDGMLCQGAAHALGECPPTFVLRPPKIDPSRGDAPFGLLVRHARLSDDVALRFGNKDWKEWPLRAERFAQWIHEINGNGYLCNLFLDYTAFGARQERETGIFDFLNALPEKLFDISPGENHFCTPSQALAQFAPEGVYDMPEILNWSNTDRDASAWLGNMMQLDAYRALYELREPVMELFDREADGSGAALAEIWRKLSASDHVYHMRTISMAGEGACGEGLSRCSPYDSYINFMSVLDHLRDRVAGAKSAERAREGVGMGLQGL